MQLGAAIAEAIRTSPSAGTQQAVADELGVDQTTVSRWKRGRTPVTVATVLDIEAMCELPRGTIFVMAGLAPTAVEDAIAADPTLDPGKRTALLATYRAFQRDD